MFFSFLWGFKLIDWEEKKQIVRIEEETCRLCTRDVRCSRVSCAVWSIFPIKCGGHWPDALGLTKSIEKCAFHMSSSIGSDFDGYIFPNPHPIVGARMNLSSSLAWPVHPHRPTCFPIFCSDISGRGQVGQICPALPPVIPFHGIMILCNHFILLSLQSLHISLETPPKIYKQGMVFI